MRALLILGFLELFLMIYMKAKCGPEASGIVNIYHRFSQWLPEQLSGIKVQCPYYRYSTVQLGKPVLPESVLGPNVREKRSNFSFAQTLFVINK